VYIYILSAKCYKTITGANYLFTKLSYTAIHLCIILYYNTIKMYNIHFIYPCNSYTVCELAWALPVVFGYHGYCSACITMNRYYRRRCTEKYISYYLVSLTGTQNWLNTHSTVYIQPCIYTGLC